MDRHTIAVSQSRGNATADCPPPPLLLSDPVFPIWSQTPRQRFFFFFFLQTEIKYLPIHHTAVLKNSNLLAVFLSFCHLLQALAPLRAANSSRSQISIHLASAVVSNASMDINMAHLISKCLGIKG